MERRFLKGPEFESLIKEHKFKDVESIDALVLLGLKHNGHSLVRVPKKSNENNPFDGFCWSKTKFKKDKTVEYRHQPTYSNIEMFGQKKKSINCTEFDNCELHKQVVHHEDYIYIYYFSRNDAKIVLPPDERKRRLDKNTKETLRTSVLPYRNMASAVKVAREMGLSVTKKQVRNMARSVETTVVGRSGPRSATTLQMAKNLESKYPGRVWIKSDDSNLLSEFTFCQTFEESCNIFMSGCPKKKTFDKWIRFVERLKDLDEMERKKEVKKILIEKPSGLFMPSRIYVDTTFNLSDMYVTIVLGETENFRTKVSGKPRVLPLGYMVHSSKSVENHQKFAEILKEELMRHNDPLHPKSIPCVLLDGEIALNVYPEKLETNSVRCDVHVLSLLRFDYGGRRAAETAKPFLFGKKVNGKWMTGLFGCFTSDVFRKRLGKIQGKVDTRIYDWLDKNQEMLMDTVSAYAKLRGGHILQYSTNNQNENFNGAVKVVLSKRHSAVQLIEKLDNFCREKIQECWLSAVDGSEYVVMKKCMDGLTTEEKFAHFKNIGLYSSLILSFDAPLKLLEGLDLTLMKKEEHNLAHLEILNVRSDAYQIMNHDADSRDKMSRYVTVGYLNGVLECWSCGDTLPESICSHVLICLKTLNKKEKEHHFGIIRNPSTASKNALSKRSGSKKSDRIGTKASARNYIRTTDDISTLSLFSSQNDSGGTTIISISDNSTGTDAGPSTSFSPMHTSTPVASTDRRSSSRQRKARRRYSPNNLQNNSTTSRDSSGFDSSTVY